MPRSLPSVALATAGVIVSGMAMAEGLDEWPANQLLAEVILVPSPGASKTTNSAVGKTSSAAEQRDRARSYQKDEVPASATVIVLPEEEADGALSPRGSSPPERARENRSRASDYQHGTESTFPQGLIKPDAGAIDGGTTQDRARENRSRASVYSKGESPTALTGRVGPDGIPLVVCKDRDNVAGQIGDGLQSGSVIVILRDNKQVKVRCQ